MIIKKLDNDIEAIQCDNLLTKLVHSEKEFNNNIDTNFVVKDYFKNLYTKNNNAIFVAKEDDKVIGYIYIKAITSDDGPELNNVALIDGLYVLEEYRNQKIATKLISEAKSWAKEKDILYVTLNVLCDNLVARKLYYKEGFEEYSMTLRQEL